MAAAAGPTPADPRWFHGESAGHGAGVAGASFAGAGRGEPPTRDEEQEQRAPAPVFLRGRTGTFALQRQFEGRRGGGRPESGCRGVPYGGSEEVPGVMDIGEQKRVIIVEPEPLQAPVEEPAPPGAVPVPVPRREAEPEPVPVRR